MSIATRSFIFTLALLVAGPAFGAAAPLPPAPLLDEGRWSARFAEQVYRDADRYVQRLDWAVGLSRRQEARVFDLLVGRTFRTARRYGPRAAYPFPRRAAERSRAGRIFWNRTDDRVADLLTKRQRRAYARFLHAPHGRRHDARRYDHRPPRHRYDDRRWDDEWREDDRRRDDRRNRPRNRGRGNG